ncbi:lysine transporter LysE, partial [Mesorhizobium sp. M7A.F.Ca.AU.001.01.1.1]
MMRGQSMMETGYVVAAGLFPFAVSYTLVA